MTAATMFMDVVTNFASSGQKAWYPTQADNLERGPVRMRNALQFSLNIPAIKAGFINGLDHQFERLQDFGLEMQNDASAVPSMSIGTLLNHPIDMISAYGMIANNGVLMPRHMILKVLDADGTQVWPPSDVKLSGERVVSKQAAYIMTDILAGNTITSVNPFWGEVAGHRRRHGLDGPPRRLQDRHDELQPRRPRLRLSRPAEGQDAPGPRGRRLDGQLRQHAQRRQALARHVGTAVVARSCRDVSKGMPIDKFSRVKPKGLVTRTVDAFTGHEAQRRHAPDRRGAVHRRHGADEVHRRHHHARRGCRVRPAVAGGLRRTDGDPGVHRLLAGRGGLQVAGRRPTAAWQARAARGAGVAGGPKRNRTAYFYGGGFYPFGRTWGGTFAPTKECPDAPPPPSVCVPDLFTSCPPPEESPNPGGNGGGNKPTPEAEALTRPLDAGARPLELDDRRPVAALAALARAEALDERMARLPAPAPRPAGRPCPGRG